MAQREQVLGNGARARKIIRGDRAAAGNRQHQRNDGTQIEPRQLAQIVRQERIPLQHDHPVDAAELVNAR